MLSFGHLVVGRLTRCAARRVRAQAFAVPTMLLFAAEGLDRDQESVRAFFVALLLPPLSCVLFAVLWV